MRSGASTVVQQHPLLIIHDMITSAGAGHVRSCMEVNAMPCPSVMSLIFWCLFPHLWSLHWLPVLVMACLSALLNCNRCGPRRAPLTLSASSLYLLYLHVWFMCLLLSSFCLISLSPPSSSFPSGHNKPDSNQRFFLLNGGVSWHWCLGVRFWALRFWVL